MAVKKKQITIKNTDENNIYINNSRVRELSAKIKKDYTNVISELDYIGKAYNRLYSDQNTKGVIKSQLLDLYKLTKKRVSVVNSNKNALIKTLNNDIQSYAVQMLQNRLTTLESAIVKLNGLK